MENEARDGCSCPARLCTSLICARQATQTRLDVVSAALIILIEILIEITPQRRGAPDAAAGIAPAAARRARRNRHTGSEIEFGGDEGDGSVHRDVDLELGIAIDVAAGDSLVTGSGELPVSVTVVNRSDYPFRLSMVASLYAQPSKAPGTKLELPTFTRSRGASRPGLAAAGAA